MSGGIDPRILKLGTIRRWVVSFDLPPGNEPRHPLVSRVGGTQIRSRHDGI